MLQIMFLNNCKTEHRGLIVTQNNNNGIIIIKTGTLWFRNS